jgi:PhnB protein
MAQLTPYITFNGKCREAMTFYKECLGGELVLHTVGDNPGLSDCPDAMKDQILHSVLTAGNLLLMASDMQPHKGYTPGTNIALSLHFQSEDELNRCFNHLSSGGQVLDALKPQPWGAIFGVVSDQYGITWMFNYQLDKQ